MCGLVILDEVSLQVVIFSSIRVDMQMQPRNSKILSKVRMYHNSHFLHVVLRVEAEAGCVVCACTGEESWSMQDGAVLCASRNTVVRFCIHCGNLPN